MIKSIIVTGASAGLGLAVSGELATMGYHVIMACRSAERGEAAAAQIRTRTPDASLEVLTLDLASLASVDAAAAELTKGSTKGSTAGSTRPPLYALVCNAGVQVVNGVQRSPDGYELTFATNHLGHFLLTQRLLDHLTQPGRVVMVSSEVHQGPLRSMGMPSPRWEHPQALADLDKSVLGTSGKAGRTRYSTTKLANLYTAYELVRRLEGRQITVNTFDPGLMPETGLDRDWPRFTQVIYHGIAPLLVRVLPGTRSVARSGADLAWLVTDPQLADVTGAYFSGRRRHASSRESYDEARAAELWEESEKLVSAVLRD